MFDLFRAEAQNTEGYRNWSRGIVDASCLQTPSPDLFQLCLLCFDWERFYSLKRVPLLERCLQTSIAGCLDSICRSMAVL